ncbi:type IX secretion system membrane protein PorP/SprF [Dysgonomonas sp. 216]|uniref:PorP/SprF family type IX secretion system membrane protein n=1 Tax=Dysgonomonas sp. 216 TaxID=2302934 RepID=UPI0013D6D60F|nr:PorP/SprF family type IX secretion system membrane protein [Dysgonomonas sp. 216]NDW18325.1 type IX secretion system membrane protein PorP/SprF [Dysgonomonas sp. 216]NDW18693.1 type IX secretion system membrane protein PorP/SprF [Dysgonomonas sp. 216]
MNLRYFLIIILLVICATSAYGQWDPQISQYWRVKTFFNPAFAGETENIQMTGLYRMQWLGVENAPKTLIISGDMPFKFLGRVHGVGLLMMNESIGLYSNSQMAGQYAYKKKFKKNTLNIGAQIGLTRIGFDADGIKDVWTDENDEAKPTMSEQASVFDANIGVSWIAPNYYAGISVTHIMEPSYELNETYSSFINRAYYLTAGYNIQLRNPLIELQPSVLVKSDVVFTQFDFTGRIVYNKMFNGGISWRKDDGFVFLLGIKYKGFDAGYAYDLSNSGMSSGTSGSHELFVRYSMPIKLNKTQRNSHKSIRLL